MTRDGGEKSPQFSKVKVKMFLDDINEITRLNKLLTKCLYKFFI